MTKTIEELAREYVNDVYSGDTDFIDEAENVQTWLFAKPLYNRLTAEEKERIKVIYNEELGMAQHFHLKAKASNDISCRQHYYALREPYISRMKLLERIFGKDFFKEDKV